VVRVDRGLQPSQREMRSMALMLPLAKLFCIYFNVLFLYIVMYILLRFFVM